MLIRDSCGKIIGTKPYHAIKGEVPPTADRDKFVLFYLPKNDYPMFPFFTPAAVSQSAELIVGPKIENATDNTICLTGSISIMPLTPYIDYVPQIIYLIGPINEKVKFKITNVKSGVVEFFQTASECAKFLNCHKSTVFRNLNTKYFKKVYKIESLRS
jgi:hypothetical protein